MDLREKAVQQVFFRHKWSIHSSENIQKFLKTRFSNQKNYPKRPYQTGSHLKKWRFTKKIKRVEVSPAEEKLARKSALMAAKERKTAAVARATAAEKGAKQAEKIRILEEKLRQNEAVIAAKERKIAALTRKNSERKNKGQRIKNKEENDSILKVEVAEQSREQKPLLRKEVENLKTKNPQLKISFGVVPSAESRKAAARARRKEKKSRERKPSFYEAKEGSEQKSLPRVPEISVVENIIEEVGDENLRPATPVEPAKTPEIKAEQPEHNPPAKGGDPTPQRRVGGSAHKQQKSLNFVPSSPDPSVPAVAGTSPLGRGETFGNLPVETLTAEITALRAEIRAQIGKLEIKEEEVFAKIPVEEVGDENLRPTTPTEEIKSENPETPEPTPEPNIVIPADAGTQKAPVAELTQPPIAPQAQENVEQPEPQTAPPNSSS